VTRELLWQEYRADYPDGYGYSQFCEHLSRHVARRDLTLALDHTPGEVLMVDFSGKKMTWIDRDSGELHDCEVLVAVLPFSQYSFCIALPSQSLGDFIEGLNQSLLFPVFDTGTPKIKIRINWRDSSAPLWYKLSWIRFLQCLM
jgi:transposase